MRRVIGDDLPGAHHDDPFGKVLGFLYVVGGKHNGFPVLSLFLHGFPEGVTGTRVHACGGFIEDEEVRVGQ